MVYHTNLCAIVADLTAVFLLLKQIIKRINSGCIHFIANQVRAVSQLEVCTKEDFIKGHSVKCKHYLCY